MVVDLRLIEKGTHGNAHGGKAIGAEVGVLGR